MIYYNIDNKIINDYILLYTYITYIYSTIYTYTFIDK